MRVALVILGLWTLTAAAHANEFPPGRPARGAITARPARAARLAREAPPIPRSRAAFDQQEEAFSTPPARTPPTRTPSTRRR